MSISGLSKVWSCATLQDGMNHVAHASSDRGEDAILRELQDGCRDASRLPPPHQPCWQELQNELALDEARSCNPWMLKSRKIKS